MTDGATGEDAVPDRWPGVRAVAGTLALHAAALAAATYPTVRSLGTTFPGGADWLQHVWVMRWYRTCLLEGRSVYRCPEIQYPAGAALGNFSSLHLQSLLFFPLSLATGNDALCYNLVWLAGMLLAGLGTSALAWHALRDRGCAAFAGLLGMLSAPMLLHSRGHLELIFIGSFPLFLVAWLRFVDRPTAGRLAAAAAGYVLVATSAAYFMVFAVFPAAWYVAWRCARSGRGAPAWAARRAPWLAAFALACLPALAALFSPQVEVVLAGESMAWSRAEFERFGSPLWTYAVPTADHLLGGLAPGRPYRDLAAPWERCSYLGVVTLGLLAYAALARVRFPRAGYLWSALALCVLLSLGASASILGRKVDLPAGWLFDHLALFRSTRAPARFNLFAGVLAGVIAAAGLRDLLGRLPRPSWRPALLGVLSACAVADLGMAPYRRKADPGLPAVYTYIRDRDPKARIFEAPSDTSGGAPLDALGMFWQSRHRLTTSAGYSGHPNVAQVFTTGYNSPLPAGRLADPAFLDDPGRMTFGLGVHEDFLDYLWLFLTANQFDYLVLHRSPDVMPLDAVDLSSASRLLDGTGAKVFETEKAVVYERARLRPPSHPVHVSLGDWRGRDVWRGRWNSVLGEAGRFAVYSPDGDQDLTLVADLAALHAPREAVVREGDRVLARWEVVPGEYRSCVSPPFRLTAGLHVLSIEGPGVADSLGGPPEDRPYRLRVARLSLYTDPSTGSIAVRDRSMIRDTGTIIR